MHYSRHYNRLVSFLVSAMVTTSFLATAPGTTVTAASGPQPAAIMNALEGLRGVGWHGLQDAALPPAMIAPQGSITTPATEEKPLLSDQQVQRLAHFMVNFGIDSPLATAVTTALGLTKAGETKVFRQLNVPFDGHLAHAYHRTEDGGFLLVTASTVSARTFRADAKQQLVAAVDTKPGLAPVAIPVADAQAELKNELAYWANVADKF